MRCHQPDLVADLLRLWDLKRLYAMSSLLATLVAIRAAWGKWGPVVGPKVSTVRMSLKSQDDRSSGDQVGTNQLTSLTSYTAKWGHLGTIASKPFEIIVDEGRG